MIKGEAELIFRDIHTGEITKTHKQVNLIPKTNLNYLNQNTDYRIWEFGDRVIIGGLDQKADLSQNYYNGYIFDIFAVGVIEAGVTSPRYENIWGPGDGYYEYQNRFSPGASDRTIHTVGIQRGTTIPDKRHPSESSALLSLTAPCVQLTTETLDVFYRIIFVNDTADSGMSRDQIVVMGDAYFDNNTTYNFDHPKIPRDNSFFMTGKINSHVERGNNNQMRRGVGTLRQSADNTGGWVAVHDAYTARILYTTVNLSQLLGRIVGTVGYHHNDFSSNTGSMVFLSKVLLPDDSKIQNIHPHGPTATKPFFDSGTPAIGSGTIGVDGTWTDPDYPKMLRVDITTSGVTGVAEYKIKIRDILGFNNNSYRNDHVAIPFTTAWNYTKLQNRIFYGDHYPNIYGGQPYLSYYDNNSEVLIYEGNFIGVLDIMTGDSTVWDSSSTPSFAATRITSVVVAPNKDIWVTCGNTGLYRIHANFATIDHWDSGSFGSPVLASNSCQCCSYGNGKIWVVFDGALGSSSDNGASWTFYNTTSTPAFDLSTLSGGPPVGYERIFAIAADPNGSNDELGFMYLVSGTQDFDWFWWDSSSGMNANRVDRIFYNSENWANNQPIRFRNIVTAAPNDSIWGTHAYPIGGDTGQAGAGAIFTFGSSLPTFTRPRIKDIRYKIFWNFLWTLDSSGNDQLAYVEYRSDDVIAVLFRQDGTSSISDRLDEPTNSQGTASDWIATSSALGSGIFGYLPGGKFIWAVNTPDGNAWIIGMMGPSDAALGGDWESILWDDYGWDGASWVLDNPNSKTTHSVDETLIQGLTNSFNIGSPVESFTIGDYYTVGLVNGVLVDGAVEFKHQSNIYYSPAVFNQTSFEPSVLPATTSLQFWDEPLTWTDITNRTVDTNNISTSTGTGGCRSLTQSVASVTSDGDCEMHFRLWTGNDPQIPTTLGLSNITKRGSAINADTIDYGFRIGEIGTTDDFSVQVVENGVIKYSEPDDESSWSGYSRWNRNSESHIPFIIKKVSGTVYYYFRSSLIYTSLVPSSTSLCIDTWLSSSVGTQNSMYFKIMNDNYFVDMGSSGSPLTGKFDPAYEYTIAQNAANLRIFFDGVQASHVGVNNRDPLSTGEYSCWDGAGAIRYSTADIGKTITGTYTYIKRAYLT